MIIPWNDLKNKPLKIIIKQVFVLINQRNHADYDPEQEELEKQEEKQQKLKEWEEKIAKEAAMTSNGAHANLQSNSSYFSQIWNAIVDNIQIFIGDIHVRYEDQVSCPEKPFGLGFTIFELSAVSSSENWEEAKEGSVPLVNTGIIYKICKLKWFGIYCTTENVQSALDGVNDLNDDILKEKALKTFFEKEIATTQNVSASKQYIMNPVSSIGKLIWRKQVTADNPSYVLELDFDSLAFNLDDSQKETFEGVFSTMEQAKRNYDYRKFKPPHSITPKMDPKIWFQYAAKAVRHDIHKRKYKWTWSFFRKRRNDRLAYINLYTALRLEMIEAEEIEVLKHLELELSFDDIRLYRHLALMKLKKNSKAEEAKSSSVEKTDSSNQAASSDGWYGWLTGTSATTNSPTENTVNNWDDQFQKIYENFDFEVEEYRDEESFPFDSIRSCITCRLKTGSFTLRKFFKNSLGTLSTQKELHSKELVVVRFEGLQVDQINYPKASSKLEMKMHYFVVSEPGNSSIFSTLIEAKVNSDSELEKSDFFCLIYENIPLDHRADSGLFIKINPLKVVVNPLLIRDIMDFFTPKMEDELGYNRISEAAQDAIEGVTAVSKAGLFFALEEHKTIDLRIEADAPIFIFPAFDTMKFEGNGQVLVLDAGHMHVSSDLVQSEMKKKILDAQGIVNLSVNDLSMEMYDKFTIQFSKAKILVADIDDEKTTLAYVNPDHLLEDLDILLRLDVSILPSLAELTKFKFYGSLPRLHVNVSEHNLQIIKEIGEIISVITATDSKSNLLKNSAKDSKTKTSFSPTINSEDLFGALPSVVNGDEDKKRESIFTAVKQQTLFDVKFDFKEASVVLFERIDNVSKPIALFQAKHINLGLTQKADDFKFSATLGSLIMNDLSVPYESLYKSLISPDLDARCSPSCDNDSNSGISLIRMDYHSKASTAEGDTTDIAISISPIKIILARECILKVYHVAMTLLGPKKMASDPNLINQSVQNLQISQTEASGKTSSTHMRISINRITNIFAENETTVGSCLMEGFDVSLTSSYDIMFISGTVGKMSLFQDDDSKCMLLIEEKKALDFEFETFDAERAASRGFDSSIVINATSWRFVYDPIYLVKIFSYFGQFQEMNAVMDRARKAAYDTQQQMQSTAGKSYIQFKAKTPIIVVPNGRSASADSLLFFPGTVTAESISAGPHSSIVEDRFNITVTSLKLQSAFYHSDGVVLRNMVQDVNLIIQYDIMKHIPTAPLTCLQFKVSDINIQVTNHQYRLFAEIMQLINTPLQAPSQEKSSPSAPSHVDVFVTVPKITFEAYNCPSKFSDPAEFSLARLLGSIGTANVSSKSNGPFNFELCFSSLSIIDTRPSNSAFRDIMTPIKEIEDQFVLKYQSSEIATEYSVTIDRAKLILEVDHIFAIRSFAVNAWYADADKQQATAPLPVDSSIPPKPFRGRVSFIEVEIIVVADPEKPNTDAVILTSKNWVNSIDNILTVSFKDLGMYFCIMNQRKETQLRFLDDCHLTYTLDDRLRPDGVYVYHIGLETTKLLFRVSQHDISLLNYLINRVQAGMGPAPIIGEDGSISPAPVQIRLNQSQQFHLSIESVQAFLIDDSNNLMMPILEFRLERTIYEMSNWSSKFEFTLGISMFANYFNIKNSHWEPMIESSQFSINGLNEMDGKRSISILARKKVIMNLSHVLVETLLNFYETLNSPEKYVLNRKASRSPYIIKNSTGYPLILWTDGKQSANSEAKLVKLADNESVNWRFEDWKTVRERTCPIPNKFAIQIEGPSWETLKGVYVDQEGSNTYVLRPAIDGILHRIVVDVELQDKVKVVTFRSAKIIENSTKMEIEIAFMRPDHPKMAKTIRILPGKKYPIPIESSYHDSIYVRPADFGYQWSAQGIHWKDLIGRKRIREYLVHCPGQDSNIPNFNFQLNCLFSGNQVDYPELTMKFMAPFVLENLLPFDFRYVIQDKVSRQQHSSFLLKGCKEYLHTLDPSHLLALSISIKEKGLKQKEAVIITSTDLEYRDEHLMLEDGSGNQLALRISYTDSRKSGRLVSIVCPYLIINKTGVDMQFSAKSLLGSNRLSAGQGPQTHSTEKIEPIMFSFATLEPLRSRAMIKMVDSEWGRPVSFEAVGSEFMVNLPAVGGKDSLIGVDIQEGQGKYHMSKVITIGPRFFLRNNFSQDISYAQAGVLQPKLLKPGQVVPLMKLKTDPEHDDYHLCVRFSTMLGAWSNPFSLTQVGNIFLKLGRIGSLTEDLIRVDITIEKATIFASFSQAEERWPFKIENQTDVVVNYFQEGSSKQYSIVPGEEQFYAWDFPSFENKFFIIDVNGRQRKIEFSELGSLVPFKYPISGARGVMALELTAQGPTIILKMTPYDSSKSVYQDTRASDEFLMKTETTQILSNWKIRIEGIGISVISRDMNEIFFASAKGLMLGITETESETITNFQIKWLQVDNQIGGALNPIFIYPTILKHSDKDKDIDNPVFFATYSLSKDKSLGVEYYKWLTVLLQELSIDLDEEFLRALIDFTTFSSTAKKEITDPCDLTRKISFPALTDASDRLYFEKFLLQPIQINMSFSRSERKEEKKSDDDREHSESGLSLVYDVLTMTIGNIHDAPIRLNALQLQHPIFSTAQFKDLIMKFYMREIYGQIHRIVGSADFLGNPVGLFNNVASGVKDMFYEPLQGFEITKPEEFGIGVAKGAGSLMKKTVFGLSGSFSKFTGSIGKGLTAMTMDSKFQEHRRIAGRNRPKHVGQGMAKGTKGLVTGFASGITGIVSQPIQGAQESGIEGFFVGLGKGLLGAIAKPVIGVVDLATGVSEGIKSTTAVFDDDLDRQRLPRYIGKDKILKPYDLREALGQSWLHELGNAKFSSEVYLCHLELRIEDLAAILTETRVLMIHINKLTLEYNAPFRDIRKIETSSDTEIALVIKGSPQSEWVIPCPSLQTASWFREKIEAAYMEFIRNSREAD